MEVSRRSFLAGAAASGFAGFAAPVFTAPTPSLLRTPSKWDMTTDVVVAGSGIAGMCAATAAVDNGAKVVVFEKGKYYGGAAIINGGIMALQGGTKWQREHGVTDTPERLYVYFERFDSSEPQAATSNLLYKSSAAITYLNLISYINNQNISKKNCLFI